MNQMASKVIGRRALSFLWNMSHLQEDSTNSSTSLEPSTGYHPTDKDSTVPRAVQCSNAYYIQLQPSFVGPEYKEEIEQTLHILRKYSFIRVFHSDDGRLTVIMPRFVRDVVKFRHAASQNRK